MSITPVSTGDSLTPAQILEQLQKRVQELERELADAKAAVHDNRRLQDLSPDELSLVAVGAAGDIIKAAQTQAAEIRREIEEQQRHSSEKIQAALARAQDRATQLVTEAETGRLLTPPGQWQIPYGMTREAKPEGRSVALSMRSVFRKMT